MALPPRPAFPAPRPLPLLCRLRGLHLSCPLSSPLSRPTAIPPSPPESPRLWYSLATWMLRGVAGPLATFAKCRLVLVRTANGDGGLWSCGNNRRACVRTCSCVFVRVCFGAHGCVRARVRGCACVLHMHTCRATVCSQRQLGLGTSRAGCVPSLAHVEAFSKEPIKSVAAGVPHCKCLRSRRT